MADKRMFSKSVVDSDKFLEMPLSSQVLYFHLGIRADDDGFVNNPKRILRMVGCGEDDLSILITKRFVLPFQTGVIVIVHWLVNNYIRRDRYKPTIYQKEYSMLDVADNNEYQLKSDIEYAGIPMVDQGYTIGQPSIDKIRLDKASVGKGSLDKNSADLNDLELIDQFKFEFKTITPKDIIEIKKLINTFGEDYVRCALDEASVRSKCNFNYIESILNNWKNKGLSSQQVLEGVR